MPNSVKCGRTETVKIWIYLLFFFTVKSMPNVWMYCTHIHLPIHLSIHTMCVSINDKVSPIPFFCFTISNNSFNDTQWLYPTYTKCNSQSKIIATVLYSLPMRIIYRIWIFGNMAMPKNKPPNNNNNKSTKNEHFVLFVFFYKNNLQISIVHSANFIEANWIDNCSDT